MDENRRSGQIFRGKNVNLYWLASILFSMLWAVILLWPHLTDWYRVPVDGQNFYWMAKFQNSALFPDDPLQYADRLIAINPDGKDVLLYPASLGYSLLFYLMSYVVSPITFAKFLVFLLLPISVHYLYHFGDQLSGKETGLMMGVLFCVLMMASPDSISIASGLQRSFAIPIVIAFLYYLFRKNTLKAAVFLPLSVLIYLPVFPLIFVTYCFYFLDVSEGVFHAKIQIKNNELIIFLIVAVISFSITGWAVYHQFDLGEAQTIADLQKDIPIRNNPLNQEGGPLPMYLRFPWLGKAGLFDVDADAMNALIMSAISLLVLSMVKRRDRTPLPSIVWKMVWAGSILYGASLIAVFGFSTTVLYLPSRYSRTILIVAPFLYAASNFGALTKQIPVWVREHRYPFIIGLFAVLLGLLMYGDLVDTVHILVGWLALLIVGMMAFIIPGVSYTLLIKGWTSSSSGNIQKIILALLMGVSLIPLFYYSRLVGYDTINPTEHERELYEYVAALPEDTLLAGSPEELTGIPLFSKRNVIFRSLFPDRTAPIVANFSAYYAEKPRRVLNFCEQYEVDYFVYDKRDYNQSYIQKGDIFFEPYNEDIIEIVQSSGQYVLPEAEVVFNSGPLAVVRCEETAFQGVD